MPQIIEKLYGDALKADPSVYVKVFSTDNGYMIESSFPDFTPRICKHYYKNSEHFSSETKWDCETVMKHGIYEALGIVKEVKE